eukprot:757991-Hanusia_phi.AAC.17
MLKWWNLFGCHILLSLFLLGGNCEGTALESQSQAFKSSHNSTFARIKRKGSIDENILFIGQISYNATRDDLERFFSKHGFQDFTLRWLTDKKTRTNRGLAFIQFSHKNDLLKALKLDCSLFFGRRLRIERTASGGGNKLKRKNRIKQAKEQNEEARKQYVSGIIDRVFAKRDAKRFNDSEISSLMKDESLHASRRPFVKQAGEQFLSKEYMERGEMDDEIIRYLSTLPEKLASRSIRDCARLDVRGVEKKAAYAMGVIKHKLRKAEKKSKKRRHGADALRDSEPKISANVQDPYT